VLRSRITLLEQQTATAAAVPEQQAVAAALAEARAAPLLAREQLAMQLAGGGAEGQPAAWWLNAVAQVSCCQSSNLHVHPPSLLRQVEHSKVRWHSFPALADCAAEHLLTLSKMLVEHCLCFCGCILWPLVVAGGDVSAPGGSAA